MSQDEIQPNFTFKKIKSLFAALSVSYVSPSPASITANRCQSQNFNISFANVKYGNPWESQTTGYGLITTYEYQLPVGWILNGTTSTGSNWIAGSNSVTVTSDLSHGDQQHIKVRPTNSCGPNLKAGEHSIISISRPQPTLAITGPNDICSGSSTFTMNGVPANATVCWTVSDPNIATISGASCGPSVSLTRVGTGAVTLTGTVTDCVESYPRTKQVVLGLPANNGFIVEGGRYQYTAGTRNYLVCPGEQLNIYPNLPFDPALAAEHQWEFVSGSYQTFSPGTSATFVVTSLSVGATLELRYRYRNSCGWSDWDYVSFTNMNCDGGEEPYRVREDFDFTMSPNPATTSATITTTGIENEFTVKVYDLTSLKLVKTHKYSKSQKEVKLNVGNLKEGTYAVQVICNGKMKSKQLIVTK